MPDSYSTGGGPRVWVELNLHPEPFARLEAVADVTVVGAGDTTGLAGADSAVIGAILVNTSRGELVDATALQAELASGGLFGAGLDVFEVEPSPPDNPLFRMENVVKTPHMASAATEGSFRSSSGVVRQILQVMAGDRPGSLLNPPAWPGRARAAVAEQG